MTVKNRKMPLAGPAFRAALVFTAGILLEGIIQAPPIPLAASLGAAIPLLILFRNRDTAGNMLASAALFLAGMFSLAAQESIRGPALVPSELAYRPVLVTGKVAGEPRIRSDATSFPLECRAIVSERSAHPFRGVITCISYRRTVTLSEGAQVAVKGTIGTFLRPLARNGFPFIPGARIPPNRLVIEPTDDGVTVLREGGSLFGEARRTIADLVTMYDFGGHRDLLLAMTIGYVHDLSPETRATFTRSGIAHLLAVSGMNVGVVAAAVLFVFGFLPFSRKLRLLAAGLILLFYAGLCGFQPPVTRALIMALMVMGAFLLERSNQAENSLFAALLIILAYDPSSLGGASLQLSFAAVWALAVLYQPVMDRLCRDRVLSSPARSVIGLLAATALASAATAPITAAHFGLMPLLSLPVNLPAIPLASVITVAGMASIGVIALGTFFAPLAGISALATGFLLSLLSRIAEFGARIPLASVEPGPVSPLFAVSFAAWLFLLSRARGRPAFQKLLLYIPLTICLVWTWSPVAEALSKRDRGCVVFFSVGQGDAALVVCGNHRFLVDTGPAYNDYSAAGAILLPSLRTLGATRLDGVILSHLDTDHSGGLDTIVRKANVERIFCRSSVRDSLGFLYGSRVIGVDAGDSVSFGGGGIIMLSPDARGGSSRNENDSSLVLRFRVGGSAILFPGDAGEKIQRDMGKWNGRLHAEILKVPHHGAPGLDFGFLDMVHPQVCIISCGQNNRYGLPSASTIAALQRTGGRVLRTDHNGTIIVRFPDLAVRAER
jgi:competence protein ComEC